MKAVLKVIGIGLLEVQAVQLNKMEDAMGTFHTGNVNDQVNLNRKDSSDIDKEIEKLRLEKEIETLKQQNLLLQKEAENKPSRSQKKSRIKRKNSNFNSKKGKTENKFQGHAFQTESEAEKYPRSDYSNRNVSCQETVAEDSSGPEQDGFELVGQVSMQNNVVNDESNTQDLPTDHTTSDVSTIVESSSGAETDASIRQAEVEAPRDISSRPVLRRMLRFLKVVTAIVVIYFSGKYMYRWVAKMSRFKKWKSKAKSKISNVVSQAKDLLDEPQDLLQVENTLNPKKARAAMFNTFDDPENVLDPSMLPPVFKENFQSPGDDLLQMENTLNPTKARAAMFDTFEDPESILDSSMFPRPFQDTSQPPLIVEKFEFGTLAQPEIRILSNIQTAHANPVMKTRSVKTSPDTITYGKYSPVRTDSKPAPVVQPPTKSINTVKIWSDSNEGGIFKKDGSVKDYTSTMTIPPSSKTTGMHYTSKTGVAENETSSFGQISIRHLVYQIVSLDIQFGLVNSMWSSCFGKASDAPVLRVIEGKWPRINPRPDPRQTRSPGELCNRWFSWNPTDFGIHYNPENMEITRLDPDGWAAKQTNLSEFIGWCIVKVNSKKIDGKKSLEEVKKQIRSRQKVKITVQEKKRNTLDRIMLSLRLRRKTNDVPGNRTVIISTAGYAEKCLDGIKLLRNLKIFEITPDSWASKHTNLDQYIGWRIVKVNARQLTSELPLKVDLPQAELVIFELEKDELNTLKILRMLHMIMHSSWKQRLVWAIAFFHFCKPASEFDQIEKTNTAIRDKDPIAYLISVCSMDIVLHWSDRVSPFMYLLKFFLLATGHNVGHALLVPPVLIWTIIFGNTNKS